MNQLFRSQNATRVSVGEITANIWYSTYASNATSSAKTISLNSGDIDIGGAQESKILNLAYPYSVDELNIPANDRSNHYYNSGEFTESWMGNIETFQFILPSFDNQHDQPTLAESWFDIEDNNGNYLLQARMDHTPGGQTFVPDGTYTQATFPTPSAGKEFYIDWSLISQVQISGDRIVFWLKTPYAGKHIMVSSLFECWFDE